MLVCAPCNRTKSWQCEHCPNWAARDPAVCSQCFWATPSCYDHVGTLKIRLVSVPFEGDAEMAIFEGLVAEAGREGIPLPDVIKRRLQNGGIG